MRRLPAFEDSCYGSFMDCTVCSLYPLKFWGNLFLIFLVFCDLLTTNSQLNWWRVKWEAESAAYHYVGQVRTNVSRWRTGNVGTGRLETISREATEHYGKLGGKEIFIFCFCICLSTGSFSTVEVIYLTRRQNKV